ncbi:MAG: glycoside hydrolase family 43 protein [Verrucomicrobiota bacterium]
MSMRHRTSLIRTLPTLIFGLLCCWGMPVNLPGRADAVDTSPEPLVYRNPISSGIDPAGVRDCQVFRDGDRWFMVATSAPFIKGPNPGVRLYSSNTLTDWRDEGLILDRTTIDPAAWYQERFWAPEIHRIQDRYFLLVNCRISDRYAEHDMGGLVAAADRLHGPYQVLTPDAPLVYGNDLSFFEDHDGRVYAFWNGHQQILAAEVDLETMRTLGEPIIMLESTRKTWDGVGVEGPFVAMRDQTYYLLYSSWTRGYEIGYATAPGPLGPWTKAAHNPIYGAQNPESCRQKGVPYTGNPDLPFEAVGHGQIFTGPDGRWWISCHGIIPGNPPFLCIDPLDFTNDGHILRREPSYTPQGLSPQANTHMEQAIGQP